MKTRLEGSVLHAEGKRECVLSISLHKALDGGLHTSPVNNSHPEFGAFLLAGRVQMRGAILRNEGQHASRVALLLPPHRFDGRQVGGVGEVSSNAEVFKLRGAPWGWGRT